MTPRLLVQVIERLQLPFIEKGKFVWVAQILGENQEFVFGLIKFEIRCLSGKNQVSKCKLEPWKTELCWRYKCRVVDIEKGIQSYMTG